MKMTNYFFVIFLIILKISVGNAQEVDEIPSLIAPSPNAASLGEYVETPVGHYTGRPIINIPLYEVKSGSLSLPISISYHSGGVKVAQEASWVGLGWALNAGGTITRSIKDGDDFGIGGEMPSIQDGYVLTKEYFPEFLNSALYEFDPQFDCSGYIMNCYSDKECGGLSSDDVNSHRDQIREIVEGRERDLEPDIYYFNFGQFSGKFFLKRCRLTEEPCDVIEAIPVEQSDLNIKYYSDTHTWIITDGHGVKYHFTEQEKTWNYSWVEETDYYFQFDELYGEQPSQGGDFVPVTSSWYLTLIESATGKEKIELIYDNLEHKTRSRPQYSCTIDNVINDGVNKRSKTYTAIQTLSEECYLRQIKFENGYIEFTTSNRTDMIAQDSSFPSPEKLDSINIFSNYNIEPIKTITFRAGSFEKIGDEGNPAYSRLKLNSVGVYGQNEQPYTYSFSYYEPVNNNTPKKNGFSVDYWGYFNNKGNQELLPGYSFKDSDDIWHHIDGADKHSDEEAAKTFHLKKIQYPTGGTHEFEMGLNEFSNKFFEYYEPKELSPTVQEVCNYKDVSPTIDFEVEEFQIAEGTAGSFSAYSYDYDIDPFGSEVFAKLQKMDNQTGEWKNVYGIYGDYRSDYKTTCEVAAECYFYKVEKNVDLTPGKYRIVVTPKENTCAMARVTYSILEKHDDKGRGGGLRVDKIIINDGDNNYNKEYSYDYNSGSTSGLLISPPIFFYDSKNNTDMLSWRKTQLSSNSIVPLGASQGSFVGYSLVTEKVVDPLSSQSNGFTTYSYENYPDEYLNTNGVINPFIPGQPNPLNGKLIELEKGKIESGVRKTLLSKSFNWDIDYSYSEKVYGQVPVRMYVYRAVCGDNTYSYDINLLYYEETSQWPKLISETEEVFSPDNTSSLTKTINYEYNAENKQIYKIKSTESNSSLRETEITYPHSSSSFLGSDVLREKHMISKEISRIEKVNDQIVSKKETQFKKITDIVVPEFSSVRPTGTTEGEFTVNYKYNGDGKLIEYQKESDLFTSIIWGYNNQYPVAKVVNATTEQLYYEGFESESFKSSGAKAGIGYSNSSTYSINFSKPDNEEYILDYWLLIQGKWVYRRQSYSGSTLLSEGPVDEVRVYPEGALITTYTYKPLIGITSQNDTNGNIVTYEYDGMSRLKVRKDIDENILSQYEYNFHQ